MNNKVMQSKVKKIGPFIILDKIGKGGFSTVYRCQHEETKKMYAAKIGTSSVRKEYEKKADSLDSMTHMEEWAAYKTLGYGKGEFNKRGVPTVYETGLVKVGQNEIYSYLIMQLLGKNLSSLISKDDFSRKNYYHLAHEMLNVIKHIHQSGIVHRDIKPSNFCIAPNSDEENKTYILDLGFACKKMKDTDSVDDDFVGTPDYASTWALKGYRQTFRDDLESLGYTFLDMWLGDLPWYLAEESSSGEGWTPKILKNMAKRREEEWNTQVKEKKIPEFLMQWISYCKGLGQMEIPSYKYLHSLISATETPSVANSSKSVRKRGVPTESYEDSFSDEENKDQSVKRSRVKNKKIRMSSEE